MELLLEIIRQQEIILIQVILQEVILQLEVKNL